MSNKPLYILTENLNFFYRLKKGLDEEKISFHVLNLHGKIPNYSSIILTTSKEGKQIIVDNKHVDIIAYSDEDNFGQYILKVIAAIRVGYQESYSSLLFSIDPGTKYIGLAIFLEDYFLESQTLYSIEELLDYIVKVDKAFQSNNLNVIFKIGRGILEHTNKLIEEIFKIFNRQSVNFYLIDEISSSKIKIPNMKFPKHETAAIILSFRNGLKFTQKNYNIILNQKKNSGEEFQYDNYHIFKNENLDLGIIAEDLIKGVLSLSEVFAMIDRTFLEKQKFNFS